MYPFNLGKHDLDRVIGSFIAFHKRFELISENLV